MNELQIELTKLIGKKELTFWCFIQSVRLSRIISKDYDTEWLNTWRYRMIDYWENSYTGVVKEEEIIGHPATLSDLHRFINSKQLIFDWVQNSVTIIIKDENWLCEKRIKYDSDKDLLEQEDITLEAIISLITSNQ